MVTKQKISKEIEESRKTEDNPYDFVRRKYLNELSKHTQRDTILYASCWPFKKCPMPGIELISSIDIGSFGVTLPQSGNKKLDLILHSPGGEAPVAKRIVEILREEYDHVRVLVPLLAKSSATLIACNANEIMMDKKSSLGPIDPVIFLPKREGASTPSPAKAILQQFKEVENRIASNSEQLEIWKALWEYFFPAGLVETQRKIEMIEDIAKAWLEKYMFKGEDNAAEKAIKTTEALMDYERFKCHEYNIPPNEAKKIGLNISQPEGEKEELLMSVFYATNLTFDHTEAIKIIENQNGTAQITGKGSLIRNNTTLLES